MKFYVSFMSKREKKVKKNRKEKRTKAAKKTPGSGKTESKKKRKDKTLKKGKKSKHTGIDKRGPGESKKNLFLRFSIKEQVFFAKRLSFLINASVPILDSLHILQRQAKSKPKMQMYDRIIEDVANGQFLAVSLGRFNKVFGSFAINIIHTGETSGTLDESLDYLAEELEKKQKLRRKVFGALIYPALIITATLGIVGMLTIYVFPKILPIFASLDFELPITTKILIWLTDFLTAWGLWIGGGLLLLTILVAWLVSVKEDAHYVWDRVVLKVPLLGKIALSYQVANLTRTLGLLLKTDAGVVDSFSIAAGTTNNIAYHRALKTISDNIIKGESISDQLLKRPDLFPDIVAQMIAIGERTGKLSDTFLYLSDLYEAEVDELTKNLSSAIEPLLMIFMGVIVGFIAVSIITPIYEVTQNLNP
jgi:type IV pilus assembly protein PilC